ncbi:MAG TPA: DUF1178 family protein [Hyphomicrobiaceae bacterium]|nr:DUF1178 family protein [Hyphomicrobiaceae bacterium]
MIRYRLQCNNGHEFEAWFGSSAGYDRQVKRGQIACPECNVTTVSKAIMAPGLATRSEKTGNSGLPTSEAAKLAEARREFLALMRKVRREVEAIGEYVGPNFAEEARKIHYEEVERRCIYGEATSDEVRDLKDEGIDFLPLPRLPEDHN